MADVDGPFANRQGIISINRMKASKLKISHITRYSLPELGIV
jgi:hypothetical protein